MKCACKSKYVKKDFPETISFLKAISDENRLQIICFLRKNERCVCEIIDFLKIPQNLVSHHLKVLREADIVLAKKNGLRVFYSLNNKNISKNVKFINSLILI